ncbi:cellulose synthase subunit BcsC-related outer membrane protein [Shewanella surugensis]|uniref:BCSC C-terminal domain-containing protein n=1 Tax=Shewanella surugensis TaxID=212020 RepID=A0ABT0L8G9_9GAMM|nr:cellulose synthase subunit BcsC-related outer membrane protein [Shewanella surugensis]MCL1123642.1 BCSC C-terminal domain-containing protein [Shewanella surugensis]
MFSMRLSAHIGFTLTPLNVSALISMALTATAFAVTALIAVARQVTLCRVAVCCILASDLICIQRVSATEQVSTHPQPQRNQSLTNRMSTNKAVKQPTLDQQVFDQKTLTQSFSTTLYQVNTVDWLVEQLRLALAIRRDDIMLGALNRLFAIDENNLDGLFYQANRFLLLEDSVNAQAVMERLNQLAPESLQAQNLTSQLSLRNENKQAFQTARLFSHAGRYEQALATYDRLFPNGMPTARLALEYLKVEAKIASRWLGVKQKLMALNAQYPDTPDFQLALADHLSRREPNNPWMLVTYERLSLRTDIGRQAALSWIEALDELPISNELLEKYMFIEGYYPADLVINKAATDARLRLARETDRRQDPTYLAKLSGLALLDKGKTVAATKKLTYALTTRPRDVDILGGLGMAALRRGQHQQALIFFNQAQENDNDPDNRSKWKSLIDTATYWGLLAQGDRALDKQQYLNAQGYYQNAIKRQPETLEGLNRLAQLYVSDKQYSQADMMYMQVLKRTSLNETALVGRMDILLLQDKSLSPLLEQYSAAQHRVIKRKVRALQITQWSDELQSALKTSDLNVAQQRVDTLLALGGQSPWVKLDMANALVILGQKPKANALMKQWASGAMIETERSSPSRAEMLFAYGLYLSGQGQTAEAINTLERISPAQRTSAMQSNLTRLKVDKALSQVEQTWEHHPQQTRLELTALEKAYSEDIDVQIRLASLWLRLEAKGFEANGLATKYIDTKDVETGRLATADLVVNNKEKRNSIKNNQYYDKGQQLLAQLQSDLTWATSRQLRYGELLLQVQNFQQFDDWLNQWQPQSLSMTENSERQALIQQRVMVQADSAFTLKNYHQAEALYAQAIAQKGPLLHDGELGLLQSYVALNNEQAGSVLSDKLYRERAQLTSAQRITLADIAHQQGNIVQTQRLLASLLKNDDLDAIDYREAMKVALDIENEALAKEMGARALYRNKLESQVPQVITRPPLRHLYDNAEDNWLTRNVKTDIDRLQDRYDGHITFGLDYGGRDGANKFTQIPIEARIPIPDYYGHLLVRLDQVYLASGDIRYYDKARNEDTVLIDQTDTGTALGIGWEADTWLADLGVTPIGFAHSTWVGGIKGRGDLQDWSWTGVASRRALTSTILSYGGLTVPPSTSDPVGIQWGGVVSTGVKLNTSFDVGGPFGVWTSTQYHQLTGVDVADNTRVGLLTGGYYKWINTEDERLSSGINLMYLQYDKNLREYTLTHGGYYSPQRYFSVSLPINYYGRYQDTWAYWLRASVSQSWSQEDTPYLTSIPASSGGGLGYSLLGAVEKRVSKKWYIGASVDIERSDFYEPNHFILYARYTFNDRWQRIPAPPTPPILYSDFD